MSLDFELERQEGFPAAFVFGLDEVGRGCIAGPVVACAFAVTSENFFDRLKIAGVRDAVRDSKACTEIQREKFWDIFHEARELGEVEFAIKSLAASVVDSINILQASLRAMEEAFISIKCITETSRVLVDGNRMPLGLRSRGRPIVKGDAICFSIAASSILAKVFRDRWMKELAQQYPGYGFEVHKGYPTAQHMRALEQLGITPEHRRTFGPVRRLIEAPQEQLQMASLLQIPLNEPELMDSWSED